jgi:hypothetical protein
VRGVVFVLIMGVLLSACGAGAPHPYPAEARTHFERSCPPESAVCACTWDRITRTVTHEDYEAALARFREDGLMDPRITRARTYCIEHNPE